MKIHLETYEIRRVAAAASADYRTVSRVISGLPTRHMVRGRIRCALRARGIDLDGVNGGGT